MDRAARWGPFVALVAVRAVIVVLLLAGPWTDDAAELERWDVDRFHAIATAPGLPYVDHEVEYPPVSLGLIEVLDAPALPDALDRYVIANAAFDLAIALTIGSLGGRRSALAHLTVGVFLLPLLYLPLDLASVLCAVGATALASRRHLRSAGSVLALGVLAKLWPVLLVPTLASHARRRALGWFGAALAVGLATWIAWAGVSGPRQVVTFRGAEGWHVESSVGAVVALFNGDPAGYLAGSFRVGIAPLWAKAALLAVFGAVCFAAWRRAVGGSARTQNLAVLTTVAALLVVSPLLSPQFLAWLLPWAAVAWAWGDRRVASAAFAAVAVTGLTLSTFGPEHLDRALPLVLLTVRSGLLVLTVVWGLGALAGRDAPSAHAIHLKVSG